MRASARARSSCGGRARSPRSCGSRGSTEEGSRPWKSPSSSAPPPEEAKEWLDALALRNQAEVQITADGVLVYSFYDVRYLGGKESARDVLDA
jgi:hypothetical protein